MQLQSGWSVKDSSSGALVAPQHGSAQLQCPAAQPPCQHRFLPGCFSMAGTFGCFCTARFAKFSTLLQVSESAESLLKPSTPDKWGHGYGVCLAANIEPSLSRSQQAFKPWPNNPKCILTRSAWLSFFYVSIWNVSCTKTFLWGWKFFAESANYFHNLQSALTFLIATINPHSSTCPRSVQGNNAFYAQQHSASLLICQKDYCTVDAECEELAA